MGSILPELVTDILLRLPVKSLLRFRCLSTSFCAEIDGSDFAKNHHNRSVETNTHQKLIITNFYVAGGTEFYIADFDGGLEGTFLPLNNPFGHSDGDAVVYGRGYCNGLILLAKTVNYQTVDLAVWNPFTRRYKKLAPCPGFFQTLLYPSVMGYGLGYDPAVDDYKIVIILMGRVPYKLNVYFQVWVFGLKSSSWMSSQDVKADLKIKSCVGLFANGALYWECESKFLGFDLASEIFFDLPKLSDCGQTGLRVLGGNLYSIIRVEHNAIEFYLHVSDQGGEVASNCWRKEFTLTVVEEVEILLNNFILLWPSCYSKEVDSILLKISEIFWYNLKNKTRTRVELPTMPKKVISREYLVCWESLVSLGNDSAFDEAAKEGID